MTTEKHDPWALLREVAPDRNHDIECGLDGYDGDCLRCRVDAALAAHRDVVPAQDSAKDVVEWQMTNSPIGTTHAYLDGVDLRVRWDGQDAAWDVTRYGRCATEDEAKSAAIAAARGLK
jgi:hypothetical protein